MVENPVRISLRVIPNAPRDQAMGQVLGVWKIKIAAPPEKGKANARLLEYLAHKLGLRRAAVVLERGESARNKVVALYGISQQDVDRLLSGE